MDDKTLIELCLSGCEKSWEILFKTHEKTAIDAAKKYFNHKSDINEVTSAVFEKVLNSLTRFDPSQNKLKAWIQIITRNTCVDKLRVKKKRKTDLYPDFPFDVPTDELLPIEKVTITVDDLINLIEDDKYKIILKLRYKDELSYEEINKSLGVPMSTTKQRLHKAKILIKQKLPENFCFEQHQF